MDELAFSDAVTLAARIAKREIGALELLDHYLERVERYNPDINAVICMQADEARDRARDADAATLRGVSWGPLHGVPMTVKESYDLAGLPSTWGIPNLKDNVADTDAVSCQRLQSAGAIIFGKTNVPLNLADIQSYNEIYGTTNNPHDLTRGPGGSSGGAAAAMAAGLSGLEMGSDIGGSIRNPAHFCGVFGHKPTWGVIPERGHAPPGHMTPFDIAVLGPLARSAEDLAMVMEIVGGADELQRDGWKLNLKAPKTDFRDLKIAVWANDSFAPVDKAVADRVTKVAELAASLGAVVDYDVRPDIDAVGSHEIYENLLHSALSAGQPEAFIRQLWQKRQSFSDEDDSQLARVTRASALLYHEWQAANEKRTRLRWAWHDFFKQWDILLTPICATPAFPHDQNPQLSARSVIVNNEPRPYMEQIFWAGLTGVSYLPSTIVPTGPDDQGLPIGVQIVSHEMNDLQTIEFARMVHAEMGGFVPAPAFKD